MKAIVIALFALFVVAQSVNVDDPEFQQIVTESKALCPNGIGFRCFNLVALRDLICNRINWGNHCSIGETVSLCHCCAKSSPPEFCISKQ